MYVFNQKLIRFQTAALMEESKNNWNSPAVESQIYNNLIASFNVDLMLRDSVSELLTLQYILLAQSKNGEIHFSKCY